MHDDLRRARDYFETGYITGDAEERKYNYGMALKNLVDVVERQQRDYDELVQRMADHATTQGVL